MKKLCLIFLLLPWAISSAQEEYTVLIRSGDYRWIDSANEWVCTVWADVFLDGNLIQETTGFTYVWYNDDRPSGEFDIFSITYGPYNYCNPDDDWNEGYRIKVKVSGPGFSNVMSYPIYVQKPGGPPKQVSLSGLFEDGVTGLQNYSPAPGESLPYYDNYLGPNWYPRGITMNSYARLSTEAPEYLRILPRYLVNANQKFSHWGSDATDILNHNEFNIDTNTDALVGHFRSVSNGLQILTHLDGNSISGGSLDFKDPWFPDFADENAGNAIRNRGAT